MVIRSILRLVAVLAIAIAVVPVGAIHAQERGATLVAEGTATMTVGGQTVAASRQREAVALGGAGFNAGEKVGLWVTMPDGSVLGLDNEDLKADADGTFGIELGLGAGLPVGLHRFSARGKTSGKGAIVPFYLMAGRGAAPTEGTRLTFTPATAKQLDTVDLAATGFQAGEKVSLWVTLPDGSVIGLGEASADSAGSVGSSIFLPAALPVGRHYFTARGLTSGNTAITPFVLQYGNGLNVPGARLAADIGRAPQRSLLLLNITGENFLPSESISFWLTLPNGAVLPLGDANADSDGNLDLALYLDEGLPTGTHYLSFRSNRSEQGGFAKLFLEPGPQAPGEE